MKKLISLGIAMSFGILLLQAQDSTPTSDADKAQLKKISNNIKQAKKEERAVKKSEKKLKKQNNLANDISKTKRKLKSKVSQLDKLKTKLNKKQGQLTAIEKEKVELKIAKTEAHIQKLTERLNKLRKKR